MSISAMKQALLALENTFSRSDVLDAISFLRAAITEAEALEPVAKVVLTKTLGLPCMQWLDLNRQFDMKDGQFLYAEPVQQEPVKSEGLPDCWVVLNDASEIIGTHDAPCVLMGYEAIRYVAAPELAKQRKVLEQALDFIKATNKSSSFWLVPASNLNKTVTAIQEVLK